MFAKSSIRLREAIPDVLENANQNLTARMRNLVAMLWSEWNASLVGTEACSGAHLLGRALRAQGHEVNLIPAQFVKPFVKSNENDFIAMK